jgi:NhaA family Na+:H+ antiporter
MLEVEDTKHYFSNAVGSVLYVPGSFVYLHWTGEPLHGPELRALYIHARNLLQRYHLRRILADHRAMPTAFAPTERDWLLTDWFPTTAEEIPRVRYAALPSPDPQRRLHTDEVVEALGRHAEVAVFDDLAQATAWLEST